MQRPFLSRGDSIELPGDLSKDLVLASHPQDSDLGCFSALEFSKSSEVENHTVLTDEDPWGWGWG